MSRARSPEAIQRNLDGAREWKRRQTGSCVDCGAVTRYGGKSGSPRVSLRCKPCGARYNGERRVGTGPRQNQALEILARGPIRMKDLAAELGISQRYAGVLLHHLLQKRLVRRVRRGVYTRT